MTDTITGKGIFTWSRTERVSDRYGSFVLDFTTYDSNVRTVAAWSHGPETLIGRRCTITATVLENRESGHIGDLFRGIFPSTPDVSEIVDLGAGELFVERVDFGAGRIAVGLKPDDNRENDWFDPVKLYRLHDQTVQITVTPS